MLFASKKVSAEAGKALNFIFEIPGLENPAKKLNNGQKGLEKHGILFNLIWKLKNPHNSTKLNVSLNHSANI